MSVAETSKEAFAAIQPSLSDSRQQVLDAIEKLGRASDYQLSLYLKRPVNQISPRRGELRDLGLIELAGTEPGAYKIRNHVWKLAEKKPEDDQPEQLSLDCI